MDLRAMSWYEGHGMDRQLNPVPDSKVHGANMGPIWGRRTQVGPMLAPWTLLSGVVLYGVHNLSTRDRFRMLLITVMRMNWYHVDI